MPHELLDVNRRSGASPGEPSSEELQQWMARIRGGDAEALEALFRALYAPLCGFARTLVKSSSAAEDVIEDTFLKIWTYRERLHVRGSVKSYLLTIVRNTALDHLSRRRLELQRTQAIPADHRLRRTEVPNDAEERLLTEEVKARLQRAIDALPQRTRQTYVLYYHHHMSYAEIARAMGVSVRTVENQLARSIRILWHRLEDLVQ
ncbi:MAG: RNA polymerase sigma-70 factor [Gemmatimonadaceae bacterium]|nr:RNA polymerase sigma-70 factor [Gemmatimonadaceae bacterium]